MGHGYRRRPGRDGYADSIARLGRAVAVTLVAATQKAMGQGAVRSQMNLRICFRVRERRDVDLILGQGMLNAGWQAHTLNAPGKFLISAPEHDTPRRARAYLVTDEAVTETASRHAPLRPQLDEVSLRALAERPPGHPEPAGEDSSPGLGPDTAHLHRQQVGRALRRRVHDEDLLPRERRRPGPRPSGIRQDSQDRLGLVRARPTRPTRRGRRCG